MIEMQNMLADLHSQLNAGAIDPEMYLQNVQQIAQQSPEMFEQAVSSPMQQPMEFSMPDLGTIPSNNTNSSGWGDLAGKI